MDMSRPTDSDPRDLDVRFGRAWREHHRYVLDIAFRTLGNLAEAEDAVQEAYTRLLRVDIEEIADVRGWLVVVVGRLCLDKLRADRRRPTSPGELPEAMPRLAGLGNDADPDPADRITLDDNVRIALHLVLERLTPAERTAFVLHDVFRFSFDEVATIVGRSPAACRQLASRARRGIRSEVGTARFTVDSAEQRQVTERFITAASTGDLDGLLAVLDPDVAGDADFGPGVPAPPPASGRDAVARGVLRYVGPDTPTTLLSLAESDEEATLAAFRNGRIRATLTLSLRDGLIHHMHATVDPAKLAHLNETLLH